MNKLYSYLLEIVYSIAQKLCTTDQIQPATYF